MSTSLIEKPEQITLTVLTNALEARRWERDSLCLEGALKPLAAILPERVRPDGSWVVIENGRVIPPEEWATRCAQPGGEVLCYPKMQDPGDAFQMVSGAIITTVGLVTMNPWLMGAGAYMFYSGIVSATTGAGILENLSNLIIGPPASPQLPSFGSGDQGSSPTYGFQGIKNSTRIGAPVGVVYGTHKVGGQYIQLFTKNDNDDSVLYALLAVSEGEITAISDIEINGQPVANFRGISTDSRLGTNSQSALSFFGDKTTTNYAADAGITNTSWATYTTRATNLTAFEILVQFQGGLFGVKSDGTLQTASVTLTVEYKLSSAGGWTSLGSFTYTEGKRSVLRRTIRKDGLAAGQYDIRLQRTTAESGSLTLVDAVRRESINEILNDAFVYPNTALLGIQALATDQLSGGVPTITCTVQGVKVKVFSSATAFAVAYSNNPAWGVLDILTSRRYGLGKFLYPIELSGSWTFTSGDATVTGTGFTGKIRKGQKILVWLTATTGAIYTVLSLTSNTEFELTATFSGGTAAYSAEAHRDDLDLQSFVDWAAFCDTLVSDGNGSTEKRATCDFVFDADRTAAWDAVLKVCGLGLAAPIKLGNYLRIKFQQAEAAAQLFTMANIVKGSFQETFLPLKERANYFEVQYLNAANDYEQDLVVLEDPLLYTNEEPERKQTVSVFGCTRTGHAIRLARFYQLSNRLITRTITFKAGLDAVVCEPGDVIHFQHDVPGWGQASRAAAGSGASTIVLDMPVTLGAGIYQVMVRHSDDTLETKTITDGAGTYTTLNISGTWTSTPADGDVVAVGVTAILVKPFRVVAIERTAEFDVQITAIEYDADLYDETSLTAVNQVTYSTLNGLTGPVPAVTDLKILQLDAVLQTVWVSFKPPSNLNYATTRIYRTINGVDYLLGESREGAFPIEGLTVGELVTVTAVTVSVTGTLGALASAPTASAVVTLASPPTVTGFSWYYLDGHARLFWTAVDWVRPVEYEIRKGSAWASAMVLGRTAYTTTDGSGNGTYWLAAYDPITHTYSATPVSLAIEIFRMLTGETLAENIVQSKDEDADRWLGTVSGGAVRDAANNWIFLGGTGLFDAIPDFDAISNVDFYGGGSTEGAYEIPSANIVDLGTAKAAHVVCTYAARGDTTLSTWDAIPDFDAEPNIDGEYGDKVDVQIEINTAQGDGVFTGWRKFVPGLHVFRKVKLRAVLKSTNTGITCILTDFNWTVDMPDRIEEQHDVALPAGGQSVIFSPAFQIAPNVQVTVQDAQTGDYVVLTAKSASGFTWQVKNAAGSGVARTADYVAKGY